MVAATSRGLTDDCEVMLLPDCTGVEAPVGKGVLAEEGSSEVKMEAEDGEILYFSARWERIASLKPAYNNAKVNKTMDRKNLSFCSASCTFNFRPIPHNY